MSATPDVLANQAAALASLVQPHLPVFVSSSPDEAWQMTGPALIARMTGTVEAIVQLRPLGRTADEVILGRSFYEHAATFAWLAGEDGEQRMNKFKRYSAVERIKADNDCKQYGIPLLIAERRAYFERIRDTLPDEGWPALDQRARQADADWVNTIPSLGYKREMTFVAFYAGLYRHHSAYAHPSSLGLNPVGEDLDDEITRVAMEEGADTALLGMLNVLYTWVLQIAGHRLGWPDPDDAAALWP